VRFWALQNLFLLRSRLRICDGCDYTCIRSCDTVEAYDFLGTNLSSVGIENDEVKECSGGWVPFFIAATRMSIAIPVRGGM